MNPRQRIIALLPIKSNSERIKEKNFRDFCGKPLFRWILDTLLQVSEIDHVIVNTDARAILKEHGLVDSQRVTIRDRKPEICGDQINMNLILADDIANVPADIYLMTHATNPLLSAVTIGEALATFRAALDAGSADSLFSVDKVQSRFYRRDCSPVNHDPSNLVPTQQLEPWFKENSNLYLFTQTSFAKTDARIGIQPMMFESPVLESVDIDTQADWDFAVIAARYLHRRNEDGGLMFP